MRSGEVHTAEGGSHAGPTNSVGAGIAAVITTYCPDSAVASTVESCAHSFARVYVVDNSPTPSEHTIALQHLEGVSYLSMGSNTGLAHAMNVGFGAAERDGFNHVVTLDQDSSPATDLVSIYAHYLRTNGLDGLGALTCQYRTDRTPPPVGTGVQEVSVTMQSGTLIPVAVWKQLGPFSEELFLDVVDWEYCMRLRRRGLRIMRCNPAILDHQPATTRVIRIVGRELRFGVADPVRYYYQLRNLLWLAWRYRSGFAVLVACVKVAKVALLFPRKREYFRYLGRAVRDLSRGRMGAYSVS